MLSGRVFQNVLLLRLARRELAARDHHVLTHRLVPPNDGGLALEQAVAVRTEARVCSMTVVDTTLAPVDHRPAEDLAASRPVTGSAVRGRCDDVVRGPRMAVARSSRGRRVRPPGHRRHQVVARGQHRGGRHHLYPAAVGPSR